MGKMKKILAGVLSVAVAGAGVTAGLMQLKKNSQKEIMVTSVANLVQEYYTPSTSLEGTVVTSATQNISLDSDLVVDQVYVSKGDTVNTGDPLVSFDTTLVEMELNIARLKKQQQEQNLTKAVNRLNSLKNGGPIQEGDSSSNPYYENSSDDGMHSSDNLDTSGDDMVSSSWSEPGLHLAAAIQPLLPLSFSDSGEDSRAVSEEPEENEELPETEIMENPLGQAEYQDQTANDFSSGENAANDGGFESGEDDIPAPPPTPTPVLDDNTIFYDPYHTKGEDGITDGEDTFYQELDAESVPFEGRGTKEDPYVFLCGSIKGMVVVKGSFFNKMAGYSEDGTRVEKEGGYWYQLEFHQGDSIADYLDRTQSCIGYYLIDGSLLTGPVNMLLEMEFTIADAMQYEKEEIPDDNSNGGNNDVPDSPVTRQEAIKIQQNRIASLKLDIQESDIKIAKLEKRAAKKLVKSKLDGTVTYVGDTVSSSGGDTFMKVKSKDGFFVVGAVSELLLDDMPEGTLLNCSSYESGNFEAEVLDVSDFPVRGTVFGFGDSNPNVSYYSFMAAVTDKSLRLMDQDYITITMENQSSGSGGIVIQKAFVRTENGASYVYKDDGGVLKKQLLSVGATVDGGYSIIVKGGLTADDLVAFPYGKNVQEGMPTKEVPMDEMYGY